MARLPVILSALVLAGCATPDPVIIKVPVAQRLEPPAELTALITPPGRIFSASGAKSVACLDPEGRDALVAYIDSLRQRVAAWNVWAAPPS